MHNILFRKDVFISISITHYNYTDTRVSLKKKQKHEKSATFLNQLINYWAIKLSDIHRYFQLYKNRHWIMYPLHTGTSNMIESLTEQQQKRPSRSARYYSLSHTTSHELILHLINVNKTVSRMKKKTTEVDDSSKPDSDWSVFGKRLSAHFMPHLFLMRVFIVTLIIVKNTLQLWGWRKHQTYYFIFLYNPLNKTSK